MALSVAVDPPEDCSLCPRLKAFRDENKETYPDYHNAPVASFGDKQAKLLIVGLAPGLHGANRTARPFTGDYAGDLLYATLAKFKFSTGTYNASPDDGVKLKNALITNAVRCLPPQNKPVGAEITACRPFLMEQISALKHLRAILCLGRIAHVSVVSGLGMKQKDAPFGHGAAHSIPKSQIRLFDSYHCSRYNTNTRRLTTEMFEDVFADIQRYIKGD